MVKDSSLEKKLILSYVKHLRIEYLIKNISLTCTLNFIPFQNILINFENLSQMVGEKKISRNLSRSDINFGAKMFFTLNSCPSFYVKLYWKTIYGSEVRMAKFASNIIRKSKDGFKVRAQKIFAKISSVIGFKHIFYRHEGNGSIAMNIELSKNTMDIKGIKCLSCLIAK